MAQPQVMRDPGDERDALLERIWRSLARWAVPVMMTLAYMLLMATSETDNAGKAWMGVGLLFVMVVWFVFRMLTESAALSRALSIGDTQRLLELADRHLARKRAPADRARWLVGRGLAELLRGQPAAALAALDEVVPAPELAPLAQVVRTGALLELGRAGDAVPPAVASPASRQSPALGWLAEAQRAWGRRELDAAAPLLARVIDDVRAGSATRAIAHVYAARIAEARGEPAVAARHRTAAAGLAAPDAAWLRGSPPVET